MMRSRKKPGKIALFVPSLFGGGAERIMVNLANEFADRGLKVDLVVLGADGPYKSLLTPTVNLIDLHASRLMTGLIQLVQYLRKNKPLVIVSAMKHVNVIALLAAKISFSGVPVIVSEHSNTLISLEHVGLLRGWLIKQLMRITYPWAKKIVAVSNGVADAVKVVVKVPIDRVQVIYNPIVDATLHNKQMEAPVHPWLKEKKLPVFLSAGRLTTAKDYPNLINAFSLIIKKKPSKLIILGEGELHMQLERMVKDLNLENSVDFPGFVSNPYSFFKHCDVFVLSSKWEGFGNVLVEAMACGARVVSTDCPSGPAEILENGKWGQLVNVGDSTGLAMAMLSALDSPQLPVEIRAEFFSVPKAADEYLRAIY